MENSCKETLVFSYSDIFFSYYFNDDRRCSQMIKEHELIYVYSGELLLHEKDRETKIHRGECVFLRKDCHVSMTKQPHGEEQFQAIFMLFKRNFLREFYQKFDKQSLPETAEKHPSSVVKLPQTPDIEGLFQSMLPYFDSSIQPSEGMMQLKQHEGVFSLLNIDNRFAPTLFDFTEPWKIDILDFLDKNYMHNLSIEEIAGFTGRSLATFKRDFKKVSALSPEKWLINKRLDVAHEKIRYENRKVSDVYLEVGFKNLSHFSSAFKKQFGYSPTTPLTVDSGQ